MMEAERTFETLVNFYQTTRHYNPEDSHLRNHRRENLKSCLDILHSSDTGEKMGVQWDCTSAIYGFQESL
jgi:hypothetical protein